ncbi:NUDIX hydrolase [Aurantiacibacter zhengii]|uniref:NUDIX domain-containing protein n=1 Tax=Aurantiacibacter zhengii TaxID=2307003 RepID=A0A418NRQ2_9SPHN|nr:NUDIX domain-containing protein [Aurantiacibacter zhengii]RIV85763.1 NUDIX domain-containing protein [Aurantiacibacter zhengii]
MLHLIPAPLHRAVMPLGYVLRKYYLRIFKPRIAGVAVFIRDEQGRVLLIRQSYGSGGWTTPAGGAGLDEDPEHAIRREVREELSCELVELVLLHEGEDTMHGAPQRNWVFHARADRAPCPDRREVVEARWFHLDDLPFPLTGPTERRLRLLEQG